ncbi:MAG TPA: hypothetical protein VNO30_19870 [Kofleriaceae bacterium]|nr:hypothetical protein [Kofleriaceae bacterium]
MLVAAAPAASAAPAAPAASPITEAKPRRDRVAVIDLGPSPDSSVRAKLAAAVVAAGLEPVIGDGVEDALAGAAADRDEVALAAALGEARRAFGALECPAAIAAGKQAAGIAAARQAAGLAVPELARAWTYVLLCADRTGDADTALAAAARLRAAGGSADVPADLWTKYPEVDATGGGARLDLEIEADVPGAAIWIDHQPAGTAPLVVSLTPGEHVIAAAAGSRRGWAAGTAVRAQQKLQIPTADQAGAWSEVGRRVASWKGELPPPEELGWVLARVRARAAIIRRGDSVEAWGRTGLAEKPHRLGGDDATAPVAEAGRVIALVVDRLAAWRDRAPDPDRPLLVEDPRERQGRRREEPARWWVYAAIIGAVGASAAIVLVHEAGSDRQRVELHFP